MWQKYDLNSNDAKQFYVDAGKASWVGNSCFYKYSPAYLSSNENVSEIINVILPRGKTALSVLGSGDMALCLSAYGARLVDTFDISINAYLVMRLKMHMLQQNIDKHRYESVLNDLSGKREFTKSYAWEFIYDAFKDDKDILKYLYDMDGCTIFGSVPGNPYWKMADFEFNGIKYSLPKSYNFTWSSLYDLPSKIKGKAYDIIYLSNILQYADNGDVILNTVKELRPHLNKNGTIVLDALNPMYSDEYEFLNDKLNWAKTIYSEAAGTVFLKAR